MRKKGKRKASQKEEAKSTEETTNKDSSKSTEETNKERESSKAGRRAKRVKASNPESEPEFFSDKRNLEDLWKQVFPVGTELDHVYQYKWNFSNLENAFEEGGELYGKKVYLFGCTELSVYKQVLREGTYGSVSGC